VILRIEVPRKHDPWRALYMKRRGPGVSPDAGVARRPKARPWAGVKSSVGDRLPARGPDRLRERRGRFPPRHRARPRRPPPGDRNETVVHIRRFEERRPRAGEGGGVAPGGTSTTSRAPAKARALDDGPRPPIRGVAPRGPPPASQPGSAKASEMSPASSPGRAGGIRWEQLDGRFRGSSSPRSAASAAGRVGDRIARHHVGGPVRGLRARGDRQD